MAASNPSIPQIAVAHAPRQSFYDRLNSQWHERALFIFMAIVLGHWGEHLAQAYQIWVMGLWYPWLIKSEALHYGYALIMLIGIWVLRKGFAGRSYIWWMVAFWIQFWHHIEHLLLIGQATFHHNLFGKPVPFSIVQLFIPRVQLHLFYNSVVFIPMVIAMYYHMFPSEGETKKAACTCSWRNDELEEGASCAA